MNYSFSEELTMVRDTVRDFVTKELVPLERELLTLDAGPLGTRGAPMPAERRTHLKRLAIDQGLWSMNTPEAFGGGGLSVLGACLVAEELGRTFVEFDFGDVPPALFDANPEQRVKYLAPVVAGEMDCAVAWREPDSDEIRASAAREGDSWRLNGVKCAQAADVQLVLARADEGISCFIVSGLALRAGRLILDNVTVAPSDLLGEAGKASALGADHQPAETTRAAARCAGIASRLLDMSLQYAQDWKALGQALVVRPAVQSALADMSVELDAARGLIYQTASEIDSGHAKRADAIRAHHFATGVAQRALDRTIQIYGGPAREPAVPLQPAYRKGLDPSAIEEMRRLESLQIVNQLMAA